MRNLLYILTREAISNLNNSKKNSYSWKMEKDSMDYFIDVAYLPLAFLLDTVILPISLVASLITKKFALEEKSE